MNSTPTFNYIILGEDHLISLNNFIPLVHEKLHQIACRLLSQEGDIFALSACELINEVYLKLCTLEKMKFRTHEHFLAFARQSMRRILVDYSRARKAIKRGAGERSITYREDLFFSDGQSAEETYAMDRALKKLKRAFPRGRQIIYHRIDIGLSFSDIAEVLGVSTKTIQRDWIDVITYLRKELF